MPIRVYNADDHPILCKGISDLIQQTADMEFVGSATNGRTALNQIQALKPDVAVLDIEMPEMTGMEVAKALIKEESSSQVVLLTLFKDESFLTNAIEMGIKGYLLKESSEKEILDCIRSVAEGKAFVSASMAQYLISAKQTKSQILTNLTDHEINILKLIAKQKTTAEIADMLFISPKTVGNHRTNISKKLELSGEQNALLKWAMDNKAILG
ncbi:MAG: DNA-binding NarL/FixJ family response regulator [Bacteroidia bacterium]|jgi:DNA-binding NarL/FixJ family response regulator